MDFTKEQIHKYGMRDIPGYEGLYAITSCGKVWSYKRKIFLKPKKVHGGYMQVNLYKNGIRKFYSIHRLNLMTYKPIKNMELMDCDHINFNVEDNYLNNLQWLSKEENNRRKNVDKQSLSRSCKKVLCVETNTIYLSQSEASRQTGVRQNNISDCCRGKQRTAGGYHWQYIS